MRFIAPLVVFAIIAAFLYSGLSRDPREVPSPLIGKAAPEFTLPVLHAEGQQFSTSQMQGRVWLLNIWATWCAACRVEHPLLVDLARSQRVEIVGLNYKDDSTLARQWLKDLGDPYITTAVDADGRVGIDWGFYGAPETFVIDKAGVVRHKHIGPVSPKDLTETILPLVESLQETPG
jgi:cytochrome c biogenesis protein CcmG/thiol:disulfide interchange protein DsbE